MSEKGKLEVTREEAEAARTARTLKISGLKTRDKRSAPKVCVGVSSVSVHCKNRPLIYTPDTGAETTAIEMSQIGKLGLSESDLSPCTGECVFAANNVILTPKGSIEAVLSLGTKSVVTTIEVFQELDDALMSWYNARALQVIPEHYSGQISAITTRVNGTKDRIEHDRKQLLDEFSDILVDAEEFHMGAALQPMDRKPMQIQAFSLSRTKSCSSCVARGHEANAGYHAAAGHHRSGG